MEKPILDEPCKKIFILLVSSDKTLRFNELHKHLNQIGVKMSKPTLINHLRHLVRRKLLIRKREGKQNISYSVNWGKLETLKQSRSALEQLRNNLQNKKIFKSFPINEQVVYVSNLMTVRHLYQLKLEIQSVFDPSRDFEHTIQYLFIHKFFQNFEFWLLENCRDAAPEDKEKALSVIDNNIDYLKDGLFNKHR